MANKALLILENPWWTPKENPKRASVLPYFQGLERFRDDFNIYYSTFYEHEGLRKALEDDLTNTREERLFLYIASHGRSAKILGGGMRLATLLNGIKENSEKIEGVLIGSCLGDDNTEDFQETLKGSNIHWIFSYNTEVDWLTATFIDTAIFNSLMDIRNLESAKNILRHFKSALENFNGKYIISNAEGDKIPLRDSITLCIHPRGSGKKPHDVTETLNHLLGWNEEED